MLVNEIAMNYSTYSRIEKSSDAHVGFEFEMIFGENSDLYIEPKSDHFDMSSGFSIEQLSTLDEISEYFYISDIKMKRIEMDYEDWVNVKQQEYVDENLPHYMSNGEDKEEAMEHALGDAGADFDFYIKDIYHSVAEFVRRWDLNPLPDLYILHDGMLISSDTSDFDGKNILYPILAKSLSDEYGITAEPLYSYHEVKKSSSKWYIEPDGSILANESNYTDVELVSAAMPLTTAMSKLGDVFSWMQKHDLYTNKTTGLHINISIPGIEDIDPFKLVLFLGEKYSLDHFNRYGNTYARLHTDDILATIRKQGVVPKKFEDFNLMCQAAIKDGEKYRTVNFRNLKDGYFEFRVAGGQGYENDYDKIKTSLLRFVTVLEIACNPDLEKQEYIKKAELFFNTVSRKILSGTLGDPDQIEYDNARDFVRFPVELDRFKRDTPQSKLYIDMYRRYLSSHALRNFVSFLILFIRFIDNYNYKLTPREYSYLKLQLKRQGGITEKNMLKDDIYHTNPPDEINILNKFFGLERKQYDN